MDVIAAEKELSNITGGAYPDNHRPVGEFRTIMKKLISDLL